MNEAVFLRLMPYEDKASVLDNAIQELRVGRTLNSIVHVIDPTSFGQIPGSTFAYWVKDGIRRKFIELPRFESNGREARLGDHPSDDFKYLRLFWEIPANTNGHDWIPYQKGGNYSPYYNDIHLVVDWDRSRQTYRGFYGRLGRANERPSNYQYFFRPGITWPRRTDGLSFRILPVGCIFADKGPTAFVSQDRPIDLLALVALMNSQIFYFFVQILVARVSLAQSFEVGIIQTIPTPNLSKTEKEHLCKLAKSCLELKRDLDTSNECSHVFYLPSLLQQMGNSIKESINSSQDHAIQVEGQLTKLQREIDDMAFQLYGVAGEDRQTLEELLKNGKQEGLAKRPPH